MEAAHLPPTSDVEPAPLGERRVTFTVPATLHEWLKTEARSDGVAVSTYVRRLVIRARREAHAAGAG